MKIIKSLLALFVMAFITAGVQAAVSPMDVSGATTVDGATAKKLFDREVLFVDVRSNNDWEAGRVPGAVHIELKKIYSEETLAKEGGKGEEMVIYCNGASCMRSSDASVKAVVWGFKKVYYYRDGFPDWKSRGFPVE